MKYIAIFILVNLFLKISTLDNPGDLEEDYPFSLKKGYNEAVLFMKNSIKIFNVSNTISSNTNPISYILPNHEIDSSQPAYTFNCNSGEEKGGIYFKSYYYTSCLTSTNSFDIITYKYGDFDVTTITSLDFTFSTGSIRFFRKSSTEELVGVAWLDTNKFNIYQLNENGIINSYSKSYSIGSNIGRDIDCLYINKHQRIICIFSYKDNDNQHSCQVNIFSGSEANFESNTKTLEGCVDHLSRKIRGNTDNNENSDIFYYYFVGTDNNAYIMPLRLRTPNIIEKIDSNYEYRYMVLKGCDQRQGSFDFAEDKFLGYNVFSCVENQYSTRIKIQLFKIENGEIIFSNGDIDNPFIYTDDSGSEISMINFVVLKESLSFGFLSYKISSLNKAKYTIINKPTCININIDQSQNLFQFGSKTINFDDHIKNDNYVGVEVNIVDYNPGLSITISTDTGTTIGFGKIKSVDYITGELEFHFKAKNNYYESELCTGKVYVNECFENCKKCKAKGSNFFDQKCKECKEGFYEMEPFTTSSPSTISCCKENVDCPGYLYLNNNKFSICPSQCLNCTGGLDNSCITCFNKKELRNYSINEQIKIKAIKDPNSENVEYFWENESHQNCISSKNRFYLNEETLTFMPCYESCKVCEKGGDSHNHNCKKCLTTSGYYHFLNETSSNCYKQEEVEHNYYLYQDSGANEQKHYFKKCNSACYSCSNGNECTDCPTGTYKYCPYTGYLPTKPLCYTIQLEEEFIDINNNCIGICDPDCKTCDGSRDSISANCLSCNSSTILLNKNCYSSCPAGYYKFENQCVSECPRYTIKNEADKECKVCSDIYCIYLGEKGTHSSSSCTQCDVHLPGIFKCNDDYNILDDCYEECDSCSQKGTITQMNCLTCKNTSLCLVEGI